MYGLSRMCNGTADLNRKGSKRGAFAIIETDLRMRVTAWIYSITEQKI